MMGSYGIILFVLLVVVVLVLKKKGVLDKASQKVLDKAEPLADKVHEGMAPIGDKINEVGDNVRAQVEAKVGEAISKINDR